MILYNIPKIEKSTSKKYWLYGQEWFPVNLLESEFDSSLYHENEAKIIPDKKIDWINKVLAEFKEVQEYLESLDDKK